MKTVDSKNKLDKHHMTLEKLANRLTPPLPGKMVIVPLELVPFYLHLHNRKIVSLRGDTATIKPVTETDGQHG